MGDPYIDANVGLAYNDPRNTRYEPSAAAQAQFINSALYGLPQGAVENKGLGKVINAIFPKIVQGMIDKAGGRDYLKSLYAEPGHEAASFAGNFLQPTNFIAPAGILKNAAIQGVSQGVTALNKGEANPLETGLTAAALGGGFGLAAKGIGKLAAPLKANPQKALEDLAETAARANLETSANTGVRQTQKMFGRQLGKFGGAEDVAQTEARLAARSRELGLDTPEGRKALNDGLMADYQLMNRAAKVRGISPATLGPEISRLPSVQKLGNYPRVQIEFGDALDNIAGAIKDPATKQIQGYDLNVTLKNMVDSLNNYADAAYRASRSASPANAASQIENRLLYESFRETKDLLNKTAIDAVNAARPGKNLSLADLNERFVLGKYWDLAEKGQLGKYGSLFGMNSKTAARMGGLKSIPRALLGDIIAPINQTVGRGAVKGVTGKIMDANLAQAGSEANKFGKWAIDNLLPGGYKTRAALPALGGAIGGMTGQPGEEAVPTEVVAGQPPVPPPPTQGAGIGMPSPGGGQPAPSNLPRAAQAAIAGITGQQPASAMPTPAPQAAAIGTQPERKAETPAAINMKYGYQNSSLDKAVLDGIERIYQNTYRSAFAGMPDAEKDFHDNFVKGALDALHEGPGGVIDTTRAAKVLFPGQEQQQAAFTQAAQAKLAMDMAKKAGAFQMGAPWLLGDIKRVLPGNQEKVSAYRALESVIQQSAGAPGVAAFHNAMNNIGGNREKAVENILRGINQYGWSLYDQALGVKR